jgi:hypothetical protein
MELKRFKLLNNIFGFVVFVISAFVYLSTIEPTASFWDCGEFIASSYKLEIGHPPGNPVFQLIARFFTLFGDKNNAAMLINAMSALLSALTITFLFWTITHLVRRIFEKNSEIHGKAGSSELSVQNVIAIIGSGLVGSLAYSFSDTFWFSAVEAEVYAMSSLFTAVVFWAMLKWEEQADKPYANRWIILISFLMGLSIGVHLLNLLTIPALVFIYYYKKHTVTKKGIFYVLVISAIILGFVLFGIIPYLPKIAAWFDLFFVNALSLPFNSGAVFFMVALLATLFFFIYRTYKKRKVLLNTILLASTMIVIGYSSFAMIIIRSSANTPTNEYQPDNPFTLVRYLGREQYGSNPLVYGESYASRYDYSYDYYYNKFDGKYKKFRGPVQPKYYSEDKMFFPRMWSSAADHIKFYESYTKGRGKAVPGSDKKIPLFSDNLAYFFDYQVNWMYLRYFMWNFAGRQNDIQGSIPGDPVRGNWESGIKFIDQARLGDQSIGPDYLVHNRGKNHYYLLPLLLGFIGLFYQLGRDKRNSWIVSLLFLLTGLAVVVYLNQYPFQPRERDYAYAGSFYAFAIWIGLGTAALYEFFGRSKKLNKKIAASLASVITIAIPFQMLGQNWDDHDRSNRYAARDMAYNYLMSCDKNAILVTHGDNDTFPLWYIQEVEGVRTDVRIVNTSLLGMDWYINQMKFKVYDSQPLDITMPQIDYMFGTNDYLQIEDQVKKPIPLKAVMNFISDPNTKFVDDQGESHSYMPARQLTIPVDKAAVIKNGILQASDSSNIVDTIQLNLPEGKRALTKTEMIILDILGNYKWDRPIYFAQMGGDLEIGIRDYLEYDGFAYKFIPVKSKTSLGNPGRINTGKMYDLVMNVYRWGNINVPGINIDYQHLLTFSAVMPVRNIYTITAKALADEGKNKEAIEVLDKMQTVMIQQNYPLSLTILGSLNEYSVLDAVDLYLRLGEKEKGKKLGDAFVAENYKAAEFFAKRVGAGFLSEEDTKTSLSFVYYVIEVYKSNGFEKESEQMMKDLEKFANRLEGKSK